MMKLLFAALLLLAQNVYANVEALEAFVTKATAEKSPPSASVAVLMNGEIVYEGAFGCNDSACKQHTSLKSVYHAFSLTKILTAVVMVQLIEEGKASLNDNVSKYFPRFRAQYDDSDVNVTLLELLNHSSGITDFVGDYRHLFDDERYEEALRNGEKLPKYIPLSHQPGSESSYSSAEYIVLGKVIEKIEGEPFDEVVTRRILTPVGMKESGFTYTPEMASNQVYGTIEFFSIIGTAMRMMMPDAYHDHYEGTTLWLKQFDVQWQPAGGLVSSIHDMALFLQAYLRGKLLSPAGMALINDTPTVIVHQRFSSFDDVRFGIGWYHLRNDGHFFLQHQGVGPGFRTIMRIYPKEGLAFVVLTDQTGTDIDHWGDVVFDNFSGKGK